MLHYTVRTRLAENMVTLARFREMSTLPAGYILQCKVTEASSSGTLAFIMCVKCCRMVDSVQDGDYRYPGQYMTVRPSVDCRSDDTAVGA